MRQLWYRWAYNIDSQLLYYTKYKTFNIQHSTLYMIITFENRSILTFMYNNNKPRYKLPYISLQTTSLQNGKSKIHFIGVHKCWKQFFSFHSSNAKPVAESTAKYICILDKTDSIDEQARKGYTHFRNWKMGWVFSCRYEEWTFIHFWVKYIRFEAIFCWTKC